MGNPRPERKANAVDCRHPFQIACIRARDRRARLASSLALHLLRPNSLRRRQHQGWEASIPFYSVRHYSQPEASKTTPFGSADEAVPPCSTTFRRMPGDPRGARLAIAVPVAQAVDDRTIRPVIALAGVDEMGELVMQ